METLERIRSFLSQPAAPLAWLAVAAACAVWVAWDLRTRNHQLMSLMKVVWTLTALYAGPVGLMLYRWSGRRQIVRDSLWRRAARSTAHCYSGCGLGEIVGVFIAVGLLGLGSFGTSALTFALAYAAGFALTAGPLMQEGVPKGRALRDAFLSETPSIAVMEIVAIGVGLTLAQGARVGEPLFWSALIVSLLSGLAAAYPVNVALVRSGVKEGMMDPRMKHGGHG